MSTESRIYDVGRGTVEAIAELADRNAKQILAKELGVIHIVHNRTFIQNVEGRLEEVSPRALPPIEVRSLQGLLDLILQEEMGSLLHISSPERVTLYGTVRDDRRPILALAKRQESTFPFNRFMEPEDFIIHTQSLIGPDEHESGGREALLELCGTVGKVEQAEVVDDGVSQSVSLRQGNSLRTAAKVQNPFMLRPHRTFAEVSQPESPFVLRLKDMALALFLADNGLWELEAMANIRTWFEDRLAEAGNSSPSITVVA